MEVKHQFVKKHFGKFTYCTYCGDFIWGLGKQGFGCTDCKVVVHKKCLSKAKASLPCTRQPGAANLQSYIDDLLSAGDNEEDDNGVTGGNSNGNIGSDSPNIGSNHTSPTTTLSSLQPVNSYDSYSQNDLPQQSPLSSHSDISPSDSNLHSSNSNAGEEPNLSGSAGAMSASTSHMLNIQAEEIQQQIDQATEEEHRLRKQLEEVQAQYKTLLFAVDELKKRDYVLPAAS